MATTREMDRLAAALGLLDAAELRFQPADDIPNGGVLCALPALLALGLLRHTPDHFALQRTIREDLVPRLLLEVPGQPTGAELDANPLLPRFTLIFDREGYSPDLFAWLWTEHRIAILSYHKHPGPDWDAAGFSPHQVTLVNGEEVILKLAERGTCLPNGFWLREIRKLDEIGHQTSILSTRYLGRIEPQAAAMFARWHQENFFKYMRQHYGLDRMIEHGTSPIPDTTRLVNPAWRALDSKVRSTSGRLTRRQAEFAQGIFNPGENPAAAVRHEQRQGELLDTILGLQAELAKSQADRKQQPKHITLKDLPEDQRFAQLRGGRKLFIDTIKLIAYRAETALVELAREVMKRSDDARSLIRGLIHTSANLRPDPAAGILNVELHGQSNPVHDAIVASICEELNATETSYPGTDLRLNFTPLRSSAFPAGQDV